jgi:hypothetical protein
MWKELINKVLGRYGYAMVRKENWRPRHNFERLRLPTEINDSIRSNSMLNDLRLINIVSATEHLVKNDIPGVFVECGVWKGGSVALMAYSLKKLEQNRDLHLFDCFVDICQPDSSVDGLKAINEVGGVEFAKGELRPVKGIYDSQGGSGDEVKVVSLLVDTIGYPSSKIFIHKGWFQETLPNDKSIHEIALLRLDGDWYASTKVCLEYLYDKVVQGGIIIVDDYGCYEGCRKAVDEFLQKMNAHPLLVRVDDDCIYWVKN